MMGRRGRTFAALALAACGVVACSKSSDSGAKADPGGSAASKAAPSATPSAAPAAAAATTATPAAATTTAAPAAPKGVPLTADNASVLTRFDDEQDMKGLKGELTAAMNVRDAPDQSKGKVITTLKAGTTVSKIAKHGDWFLVTYQDAKSHKNLAGWVSSGGFKAKGTAAPVSDFLCACFLNNAGVGIKLQGDDVPRAQQACRDMMQLRADCNASYAKDCDKWWSCMNGDLAPTSCPPGQTLVTDPDGSGGICLTAQQLQQAAADDDDDPDTNPSTVSVDQNGDGKPDDDGTNAAAGRPKTTVVPADGDGNCPAGYDSMSWGCAKDCQSDTDCGTDESCVSNVCR